MGQRPHLRNVLSVYTSMVLPDYGSNDHGWGMVHVKCPSTAPNHEPVRLEVHLSGPQPGARERDDEEVTGKNPWQLLIESV